jgi:hypothetical protein
MLDSVGEVPKAYSTRALRPSASLSSLSPVMLLAIFHAE